jgi:CubicO group peptidase (beta-lactamase class C family)
MRRSVVAFAIGLLALTYAPLSAADLVYARFGDYLEALRTQIGIPGLAAAVVGPADVLWETGFGYQDVGRSIRMRPDTPVPLDGLTQVFTAASVLRCSEQNRLSLDATIGTFKKDAPEPAATLRQLLSHTSGTGSSISFNYQPDRQDPLAAAVKACTGDSFRETTANLLERLAMANSVPGADILSLSPPAEGIPTNEERQVYGRVLERLSVLYAVDSQKRTSAMPPAVPAPPLTPSSGLIATAQDFAQFDLALRSGILISPERLAEAWRPPLDATGKALPHGLGWFVQNYNGDPVIWQFGSAADSGSSSMVITLPARGVTLVLLANSTGLVKTFSLAKGDITTSPFAKIFLSLFTR